MKDKEARKGIGGLQSRMDKTKGLLNQDIQRIESKGDKRRQYLTSQIDDLYSRLIKIEDAVYSKFVKREYWEERKDEPNP